MLFRHVDFQPLPPSEARLGRCGCCGIVFRDADAPIRRAIDDLFESDAYIDEKPGDHRVFVTSRDEPMTPAFLQAEILAAERPGPIARALDIGCHDGALLRELAKRHPEAALVGFDVSPATMRVFPKDRRFRLVTGRLAEVEGLFDLIVLSHSLQYVWPVGPLMSELHRLLNPKGSVFVQVPDFSAKPASLLFGDLHYHYTPAILGNVFRTFGFKFRAIENDGFPRDSLGLAVPGDNGQPAYVADAAVHDCIQSLDRTAEELIAAADGPRLGVLGTTIEAAFAAGVLGERLAFFVDENPDKAGGTFHGRAVVHPRDLNKDATVLLPYKGGAEVLSDRLQRLYQARFVVV